MARPIPDVTSENFAKKGADYMRLHDTGFVIALKRHPGLAADDEFHATVRQWGAWMAYWAQLPYKTKGMQARGYATTPAEWPHEFDATATMQGDHAAADAFERRWRDERESQTFHAGAIGQRISKAVAMWNQTKSLKQKPTPESHLHPDAEPRVDVSDFPSANATAAELAEWDNRMTRKASA